MQKALLLAALQPNDKLKQLQDEANFSELMALSEELKTLPFGAVWNEYLARENVQKEDWFNEVKDYEKNVLIERN